MRINRSRSVVGLGLGVAITLLACKSNNINSTTGGASNCASASDCTNGEVCGHDQMCHPACTNGPCPDKTNVCTDGVCYPAQAEASTCVPVAGQGSGTVTAMGTWQGKPVPQADVLAVHTPMETGATDAGTIYADELDLLLTSYGSACGWTKASLVQPGFEQLQISLINYSFMSPGPTLVAGTYQSSGQGVTIAVGGQILASACSQMSQYEAATSVQSGSIKLDVLTSTQIQGSFDLTTSTGEHLTGMFNTFPCAVSATTPTCCAP